MFRPLMLAAAASLALPLLAACGGDDADITLYSGRTEALIQPLIDDFEEETGLDVEVKYGSTAEMAALLAEEGNDSPADLFLAQDAGALGAVSDAGLLGTLPEDILSRVDEAYRSPSGEWVGVSGRARVIVYNTDMIEEADLPDSVLDLTDEEWRDRVAWAPQNGSFQSFVTAFRALEGDDATEQWLTDMKANGVKEYPDNVSIVTAVANGEVELGLVNHYYLWGRINDQGEGFKARNHYTAANDVGSLVNVAGVGLLQSSDKQEEALRLVEFMLSEQAQHYFAEETFEYPLVAGVSPDDRIRPLAEIDPPNIDLSDLDDLQGTLALLRSTSVLPERRCCAPSAREAGCEPRRSSGSRGCSPWRSRSCRPGISSNAPPKAAGVRGRRRSAARRASCSSTASGWPRSSPSALPRWRCRQPG
jgi:iron(III) transport system substrate-binding protein